MCVLFQITAKQSNGETIWTKHIFVPLTHTHVLYKVVGCVPYKDNGAKFQGKALRRALPLNMPINIDIGSFVGRTHLDSPTMFFNSIFGFF